MVHIVYFDILVTIQKAVYKCTISRYVKSRKYGPYGGTYTNIAKTASASLYFHCYNPISYSGHPRGSKKYRLAKMWGGGGVHEGHIWPTAYELVHMSCVRTYVCAYVVRLCVYCACVVHILVNMSCVHAYVVYMCVCRAFVHISCACGVFVCMYVHTTNKHNMLIISDMAVYGVFVRMYGCRAYGCLSSVRPCVCMYPCIYACCPSVRAYACMYACRPPSRSSVRMHVCMYACRPSVRMHVDYVCMSSVRPCICMYVCVTVTGADNNTICLL